MNTAVVGIICAVGGLIIGFLGFFRNGNKDTKEETKEQTTNETRVEMKLDYAITGINEIKSDMKATQKDVIEISNRLIKVEERTELDSQRISRIEDMKEKI